jgi:hypothetical protein
VAASKDSGNARDEVKRRIQKAKEYKKVYSMSSDFFILLAL